MKINNFRKRKGERGGWNERAKSDLFAKETNEPFQVIYMNPTSELLKQDNFVCYRIIT